MHDHRISCLPVIEKEKLTGIVTKLDFLEPISQLEAAERKFTVQFGIKDIEVTQTNKLHDGKNSTASHTNTQTCSAAARCSRT